MTPSCTHHPELFASFSDFTVVHHQPNIE